MKKENAVQDENNTEDLMQMNFAGNLYSIYVPMETNIGAKYNTFDFQQHFNPVWINYIEFALCGSMIVLQK